MLRSTIAPLRAPLRPNPWPAKHLRPPMAHIADIHDPNNPAEINTCMSPSPSTLGEGQGRGPTAAGANSAVVRNRLNRTAQLRQRRPMVQAGSFWFTAHIRSFELPKNRPIQRPRRSSTCSRALTRADARGAGTRTDFRRRVGEAHEKHEDRNDVRHLMRSAARCAPDRHRRAQMQVDLAISSGNPRAGRRRCK